MLQLSELFHFTLAERRSNTSALSHHVIAVSQAKQGFIFTMRVGSLPYLRFSSRQLAGKDILFFGEMS